VAQSPHVQPEGIAQVAGRILVAWRSGENAGLQRELEHARRLAAQTHQSTMPEMASTLEMERLEVLSSAVEALAKGRLEQAGAVRLLEHLAKAGVRPLGPRDANPRRLN